MPSGYWFTVHRPNGRYENQNDLIRTTEWFEREARVLFHDPDIEVAVWVDELHPIKEMTMYGEFAKERNKAREFLEAKKAEQESVPKLNITGSFTIDGYTTPQIIKVVQQVLTNLQGKRYQAEADVVIHTNDHPSSPPFTVRVDYTLKEKNA